MKLCTSRERLDELMKSDLLESDRADENLDNPQCTVHLAARIEVKAHRKHVLNHHRWRLNMEHVGLDSPWSEFVDFDSVLNSNRDVLMPWHFPIHSGNLVE